MALKARKSCEELIHHSDRGIQYCCDAYQLVPSENGCRVSMSEHGDSLENAIAERVNGILKDEFGLERHCGANTKMLRCIMAQSIEIYNNCRLHFSCGLLTQSQMHEQNELQRATYHKKIRNKLKFVPNSNFTNLVLNPGNLF